MTQTLLQTRPPQLQAHPTKPQQRLQRHNSDPKHRQLLEKLQIAPIPAPDPHPFKRLFLQTVNFTIKQ